MALDPYMMMAYNKHHKFLPTSVVERAFALEKLQREVAYKEELIAALKYALSSVPNNTVAHGKEYDLLIETMSTTAKVTPCRFED